MINLTDDEKLKFLKCWSKNFIALVILFLIAYFTNLFGTTKNMEFSIFGLFMIIPLSFIYSLIDIYIYPGF